MKGARPRVSSSRGKRNERRFTDAVRAHQSGRLDDAQQLYQRVLDADPGHTGALHYLALIRHQHGALAEAVSLLQRASAASDADASLFNNLGNMLRESSRLDEAIAAYRTCIERDAAHANARINLATTLLDAGRASEAVEAFAWLIQGGSEDSAVWNAYAHALLHCARDAEAVEAFRRASSLRPGEPGLRVNLIEALGRVHAIEDALQEGQRARADFADNLAVARAFGNACMNMTRFDDARKALLPVLAATPRDIQVRSWIARCHTGLDDAAAAVELCDQGLALDPDSPDLQFARGTALIRTGRLGEAIDCLQRAHALRPQWVEPVNNLGIANAELGHMEEAESLFRKALVLDPHTPEAWFHIARSRTGSAISETDVSLLRELSDDPKISPERRVPLHFALAQILERRREYTEAFRYYASANELKRRLGRFDADRFSRWVQGFHEVFDAQFLARLQTAGSDSERPVFVLGMPRSGTSLVEQILASHPQIYGAGELTYVWDLARSLVPDGADDGGYPEAARGLGGARVRDLAQRYLQRIAGLEPSSTRLTDKMPGNHFHIALIAVMFPKARIIHCTRDAMDVCFSNFIQYFESGHLYSYSLSDIAVYYREYVRLMQHWHRLLPGRIFDVSYERLLMDQEGVSRELVAELGLEWDDACLRFYETQRSVSTASHWQVRQPIYSSASQRWRHYAAFLHELEAGIDYRDGAS